MSDPQVQMLAHLACSSRPSGARRWDEPGVVAGIRKLLERGFGIQEVIDRVFAHAWDATANTPGTVLTPKSRPVIVANPVPFPVTRAVECRLHPGQTPGFCTACAADEMLQDSTPAPPPRQDPPSYDEEGHRLRHRPLPELFAEAKAELAPVAPPTDTTEETPA